MKSMNINTRFKSILLVTFVSVVCFLFFNVNADNNTGKVNNSSETSNIKKYKNNEKNNSYSIEKINREIEKSRKKLIDINQRLTTSEEETEMSTDKISNRMEELEAELKRFK